MTSEKTKSEDNLAVNSSLSGEDETVGIRTPKFRYVLFPLGRIVATPGAIDAIEADGSGLDARGLLKRHCFGEWGEMSEEDRQENELSVLEGFRIFSAYFLPNTGVKIWVITEADRSATTLLLPEEY